MKSLREFFGPNRFYQFRHPLWDAATFIGDDKTQIKRTLAHYLSLDEFRDLRLPSDDAIRGIKRVYLEFAGNMSRSDHKIKIEPVEGFTLLVNATSYSDMEEFARNFEKHRRGELIKLQNPQGFINYIPPRVCEALKKYDWRKNDMQVNKWLVELHIDHERLGKHPHISLED